MITLLPFTKKIKLKGILVNANKTATHSVYGLNIELNSTELLFIYLFIYLLRFCGKHLIY